MTDASYHMAQAAAAYRAQQHLDPRPGALLSAIHDRLRVSLAAAISAYEVGALDQMCRHNERSTQLLSALLAALNPAAAELRDLLAFYRHTQFAVNRMIATPSAIDETRKCLIHLNSMSFAFQSHIR